MTSQCKRSSSSQSQSSSSSSSLSSSPSSLSVWSYMFFFSIHRRKGGYLAYLIIKQLDYLSEHLEVLCSSFFGRPLPLMYQLTHNSIKCKYGQKHFIHISESKYFLLQDSRKKKVNRQRAALGFPPNHEILQEREQNTKDHSGIRTKKPKATNGRREDYVRLPFVDDLCLRCAMQGFLRRKLSNKAKLTRRQIKSS